MYIFGFVLAQVGSSDIARSLRSLSTNVVMQRKPLFFGTPSSSSSHGSILSLRAFDYTDEQFPSLCYLHPVHELPFVLHQLPVHTEASYFIQYLLILHFRWALPVSPHHLLLAKSCNLRPRYLSLTHGWSSCNITQRRPFWLHCHLQNMMLG